MEISDDLNLNLTYPVYGENYLLYSEASLDAYGYWVDSNIVNSLNSTSNPFTNTLTADLVRKKSNTTSAFKYQIATDINTGVIASIYAKAETNNCFTLNIYFQSETTNAFSSEVNVIFNLTTGTITSESNAGYGKIQDAGNGWYRCSVFYPTPPDSTYTKCYFKIWPGSTPTERAGNYSSQVGVYTWGAMLEKTSENRYPLGYTATTSRKANYTTNYSLPETEKLKIGSITQTFTSSGTWTKPAGAKFVKVIAHGGGGSGSLGTYVGYVFTCTSISIFGCLGKYNYAGQGGGSGAPGTMVESVLRADLITSTVNVTVGAGGIGPGASLTPKSGTDGGFSSFGSYVTATGGAKGLHGVEGGSPYVVGLNGVEPSNGVNKNIFLNAYSGGQGGKGGNSNRNYSNSYNAGNGGFPGSYIRIGSNTVLDNGGKTTTNNEDGLDGISSRSGTGFGGDGGGGGSASNYLSTSYSSGSGGNGRAPGGGGGGAGGRYYSSANSGKGGDGARGEVIVITYF